VTFDEFYLEDVAHAALALGLKGPGKNVLRSIRKDVMYQTFRDHGVLGRDFLCSTDPGALVSYPIAPPYVVKPSQCAGSLGIFRVASTTDHRQFLSRFETARDAVRRACGAMAGKETLKDQSFIKEGFLDGNASDWFGEETAYADYISLEGMVVGGTYHPVAITQNFPLIPEFTETVSITPTTLSLDKQIYIANKVKPCIEALGLDHCGTHTEIKLLAHGEIAIIESAARFAGWSIIRQVECVFGIDLITRHVADLLDEHDGSMPAMQEIWSRRTGYTATINLLPATESGEPWAAAVRYEGPPPLESIVHPDSRLEFTAYVSEGEMIEPLASINGAWNSFGKIFLESGDFCRLEHDILSVRRNIRRLIAPNQPAIVLSAA
jgi:biotin carboxylase